MVYTEHTAQDLATFVKKKGFIYPSSQIYGGVAGLYDYGHLGTLLKRNFENAWRRFFLGLGDNYFEIETANIMHENVFKGSGHLENFVDPIAKCTKCGLSERADHLVEEHTKNDAEGLSAEQLSAVIEKENIVCPKCGGEFAPIDQMNMMFELSTGVGAKNRAFLRPETAQSPYVNFKAQFELQRKKLPLGLALIGRAYRNEISPRNLTLRQREFTQAELQIFFNPSNIEKHEEFEDVKEQKLPVLLAKNRDSKQAQAKDITSSQLVKEGLPEFYVFHLAKIAQFYETIMQIPKTHLRFKQLTDEEKAFYNKYHFDIEINLCEHGWTEVGGLHYRTDHDLKGHQEISKEKMQVIDEQSGEKFIPHVLELSFGVDRNVYSLLDLNYDNNKERGNTVLHLPTKLTPFFCALFPLVKNKPEILEKTKQVREQIENYAHYYDQASSVGRRYARADEIGVRYAITVDFDSLEDNAVTLRDRETGEQERISIQELKDKLFSLYLST